MRVEMPRSSGSVGLRGNLCERVARRPRGGLQDLRDALGGHRLVVHGAGRSQLAPAQARGWLELHVVAFGALPSKRCNGVRIPEITSQITAGPDPDGRRRLGTEGRIEGDESLYLVEWGASPLRERVEIGLTQMTALRLERDQLLEQVPFRLLLAHLLLIWSLARSAGSVLPMHSRPVGLGEARDSQGLPIGFGRIAVVQAPQVWIDLANLRLRDDSDTRFP